jgi:uncharacterized protein
MIVDAHCHAGRGGDVMTGPWDTRAPLDRYLARADRAGIEQTVLLPVFHTDYRIANREVAQLALAAPGRFRAFCMVHPVRDASRVGDLVREAVERYGAVGIKVHRHDGRLTRSICEAAGFHGVPILYDPMGDTSSVELAASEYPGQPIVVAHLGSFGDDWRAHQAVIDQLARHPNLYADTSGIRRFDYLVEAVRRAGAGRLVFGSDGPWLHPGLELAKVRLLGLRPADEALVTGGTILRLLAGNTVAATG